MLLRLVCHQSRLCRKERVCQKRAGELYNLGAGGETSRHAAGRRGTILAIVLLSIACTSVTNTWYIYNRKKKLLSGTPGNPFPKPALLGLGCANPDPKQRTLAWHTSR